MALMTGEQYVESIKKLKMKIYLFGEEISNPVGQSHGHLRESQA